MLGKISPECWHRLESIVEEHIETHSSLSMVLWVTSGEVTTWWRKLLWIGRGRQLGSRLGLPLLGARFWFLVGDTVLTGAFCLHNVIQVDNNFVIWLRISSEHGKTLVFFKRLFGGVVYRRRNVETFVLERGRRYWAGASLLSGGVVTERGSSSGGFSSLSVRTVIWFF
jgi:hypothetical protein